VGTHNQSAIDNETISAMIITFPVLQLHPQFTAQGSLYRVTLQRHG
jgi:hypothetical protein